MDKTAKYAKRIRARRAELGITQEQLQERMKDHGYRVSGTQVPRWERGEQEPGGRNTVGLELALNVPPGWLWHGDEAAGKASLPNSEMMKLIKELRVSDEEHELLRRHLGSREAEHDPVTKAYVVGFIQGMRESGNQQAAHAAAVAARLAETDSQEPKSTKRKK